MVPPLTAGKGILPRDGISWQSLQISGIVLQIAIFLDGGFQTASNGCHGKIPFNSRPAGDEKSFPVSTMFLCSWDIISVLALDTVSVRMVHSDTYEGMEFYWCSSGPLTTDWFLAMNSSCDIRVILLHFGAWVRVEKLMVCSSNTLAAVAMASRKLNLLQHMKQSCLIQSLHLDSSWNW